MSDAFFKSGIEARIAADEAELARLEAERSGKTEEEVVEQTEEVNEEPEAVATTKKEEDWKKRYSDLRRYVDTELKPGFQRQIDELRNEVVSATSQEMTFPKTEEEIGAWAAEYPQLYDIIETIAAKKALEANEGIKTKLEEVELERKRVAREKAEAQILKKHPDLDELRNSTSFHSWVKEQGGWVEQALYRNIDNWKDACNAIDLYKAHTGAATTAAKAKPKANSADAAKAVSTGPAGNRTQPNANDGYIKESEVNKMSPREFEARYDEIMKAQRSGKFVYDLSGAAR